MLSGVDRGRSRNAHGDIGYDVGSASRHHVTTELQLKSGYFKSNVSNVRGCLWAVVTACVTKRENVRVLDTQDVYEERIKCRGITNQGL